MKHTEFLFVLLLSSMEIIIIAGQRYRLSLYCPNYLQAVGSCTLTCNTSTPQTSVLWNASGKVYTQAKSSCYTASPSLPTGYTSACPTSTTYTISFDNATYSRDSKTWACDSPLGGTGNESNQITINILVPVAMVTLSNITSNNQEVGDYAGQSLNLTCVTSPSNPAGSVTWYKNNVRMTSSISTTAKVTSGVVTTSSLTVSSLARSDLGQVVYCTATNPYTSSPAPQSERARLGVWFGPEASGITLLPNTVARENRELTLTCTVTAYPAPTFTWDYSDGTATGGSTGSVTNVTTRWSQTLTFRPKRNKLTVRCRATNIQTATTKNASITLKVKYPPPGAPSIIRFPSPMFEGVTGETVTCSVTGGKPLASLTWTCPGTGSPFVSTSGQTVISTLTFTVTKSQHGQQCRCQGSWQYGGYTQSDVKTFNVSYAPDVILRDIVTREGQPLIISCQAEGRPTSYNFKWFTQYWANTEIQTRGGQQTADTYTLRIDTASYQDSGLYECSVDNTVTDRSGILIQSKKVNVTVKARPKFTQDSISLFGAEVGSNATLYRTFYSREDCTYSWTFVDRNVTQTETVSSTQVTLDIYDKLVNDEGWNVTLTLTGFQQKDLGTYNITVCNSVGCTSSGVILKAEGVRRDISSYLGVITGSLVCVVAIGIIVATVLTLYRRDYRCSRRERNDDNMSDNRQDNGADNSTYSSFDRGTVNETYEHLTITSSPQDAQLAVYEHTRAGSRNKPVTYENVQRLQLPLKDIPLRTYGNTENSDHTYVNTSMT